MAFLEKFSFLVLDTLSTSANSIKGPPAPLKGIYSLNLSPLLISSVLNIVFSLPKFKTSIFGFVSKTPLSIKYSNVSFGFYLNITSPGYGARHKPFPLEYKQESNLF